MNTQIPLTESYFANLVECLQQGNKNAVEEIWKAFGPDLRRRARTRLRQYGMLGHTDSMDICNAVLMDLIKQKSFSIQNPMDLMKYVRRAIDNQVKDEFKSLTRARRDIRRNENQPVENHVLQNNQTSPSQIMVRNEIFERMIRQLGNNGEQILNLVLQEHTWEEIGKRVNTSPDAIRMKWNRSLKTVRSHLFSESKGGQ
ncbi:MAG: RNA polymerase sigma factor [Mariniblastus sp.]